MSAATEQRKQERRQADQERKQQQAQARKAKAMSDATEYWACSVCDSGGHPLTVTHARDASQTHTERTGHFTIYGTLEGAK